MPSPLGTCPPLSERALSDTRGPDARRAREKALADAAAYATERTAEANARLLTPEYLELKRYEAVATNTKVYFGERLPTTIVAADAAAAAVAAARPPSEG